ncbi:MAG TPA: hypothetical protein VK899_08850, partial [Gemmatimonadales bacterium]|nr:hypothetical protein [Gemmatimonadales bacterium]
MRVMRAGERGSGAAGQPESEAPDLFPEYATPPRGPAAPLPVLDQRARGTRFIQLSVRSVLNTPASTHMGFWSIN